MITSEAPPTLERTLGLTPDQPIVIAGPCAIYDQVKSPNQIPALLAWARENNVFILRLPYWKPRTEPGGFDGIGLEEALPIYIAIAQQGFIPAMEIATTEDAIKIAAEFEKHGLPFIGWKGARDQNNIAQEELAMIAANSSMIAMYKNQPWINLEHWHGIGNYALKHASRENLLLTHRGFSYEGEKSGPRNLARHDLAKIVQRETQIAMLLDPSHIEGTRNGVISLMSKLATNVTLQFYRGIILEIHPEGIDGVLPAITDANQQLRYEEASETIEQYRVGYRHMRNQLFTKDRELVKVM